VIVPDKEQFLRQAGVGALVPVFREYHADLETPVSAYLKISARFPTDHFLLESVEGGEKWARYSFIGFDPHLRFRADEKGITIRQGGETRDLPVNGDPLDALAGILKEIRYRPAPGLPRLSGGAVGYIGYDYVRYLEKVGGNLPLTGAPDAMFLFPSRLVIFDNVRHTILIVAHASVRAGEDPGAAYARSLEAIEEVRGILRVPLEGTEVPDGDDGGEPPAFEMSRETFLDAVRKAVGNSMTIMVDGNWGWYLPGDRREGAWDRKTARAVVRVADRLTGRGRLDGRCGSVGSIRSGPSTSASTRRIPSFSTGTDSRRPGSARRLRASPPRPSPSSAGTRGSSPGGPA